MKTRVTVRVLSFSVAIVLATLGFLEKSEQKNEYYRIKLQNTYAESLDILNEAMTNISNNLNKLKFVSSQEQISHMAMLLLTEAEISKTALAHLPQNGELTYVNKFLSQIGNYAMHVSKVYTREGELTEDSWANIDILAECAEKIVTSAQQANIKYNNSKYWTMEIENSFKADVDSLATTLGSLEKELESLPTLIYDGPFSDHILEKEPALLKNAERVDQETASKTAELFCEQNSLELLQITAGRVPCYQFSNGEVTVNVTRNGGETLFMRKHREINSSLLEYNKAIENAERYLERVGKSGFKKTYYFVNEGICIINFAYTQGNTVCYTDLIKVGVAMDNGEIVLYEASGYIFNHTDREFTNPIYTVTQAEAIINKRLTVTSNRLSLIPTSSQGEVRCYEFSCLTEDGEEILVYINTDNLKEEEILILLKTDGGTLVK